MVKKMLVSAVLIAAGLVISGCCSKERCQQKYGLTECTKEECEQKYTGPVPPDGPDVVLVPTGGNLVWKVNGVDGTPGEPVLDPNKPTFCKLRKDFVGHTKIHFNYKRKNETSSRPAKEIELESANYYLRIKEASWGGLDWFMRDKVNGVQCTLVRGEIPSTFTDVPTEFRSFTTSDHFEEVIDNKDAEAIEKIKVRY